MKRQMDWCLESRWITSPNIFGWRWRSNSRFERPLKKRPTHMEKSLRRNL